MITALSGFLGLPSDWDLFPQLEGYDYLNKPILPFTNWAKAFNQSVSSDILLGYSLGGRLALHALIDNPAQWKGAIIISTHPGLQSPDEKEKRIKNDLNWADKFRDLPWDEVIDQWNNQPVLKNNPSLQRVEKDFNRANLSRALEIWSTGHQDDFRASIKALKVPILWLTGCKDTKFLALSKEIKLSHPLSKKIVLPTGHRLPWEEPKLFKKELEKFCSKL